MLLQFDVVADFIFLLRLRRLFHDFLRLLGVCQLPHDLLHFPNRKIVFQDLFKNHKLRIRIFDIDDGTGMSHGNLLVPDSQLYLGWQFQQTQIIGNRRSLLSDPFAQGILRQIAFIQQPLITDGHLNGIQVFPLDVLDQGQLQQAFVLRLTDIGRYGLQSGELRSPEASLSGNNLIFSAVCRPHGDRLNNTYRPDGSGQFIQSLFVEFRPRLVRIGIDVSQFQFLNDIHSLRSGFRILSRISNQSPQSSSQCTSFYHIIA